MPAFVYDHHFPLDRLCAHCVLKEACPKGVDDTIHDSALKLVIKTLRQCARPTGVSKETKSVRKEGTARQSQS
jgi:hypothetical protein